MKVMAGKNKKRNDVLDIGKGLGIIMIVFYHIVFQTSKVWIDIVEMYICGFLGVFFIMAGYTYHFDGKSLTEKILHRIHSLLLPVVRYSFITLCIAGLYLYFTRDISLSYWFEQVLFTYFRPELIELIWPGHMYEALLYNAVSPIWFVWQLFFAQVIFWMVADSVLSDAGKTFCTGLALAVCSIALLEWKVVLPWNIQCAPAIAALLLWGAFAGKNGIYDDVVNAKAKIMRSSIFVCIAVVIAYADTIGLLYTGVFGVHGGYSIIYYFIFAIALTDFVLLCSGVMKVYFSKFARWLAWLGKRTIIVLISHGCFSILWGDVLGIHIKFDNYWNMATLPYDIWGSYLSAILSLLSCIVLLLVVDKIKHIERS